MKYLLDEFTLSIGQGTYQFRVYSLHYKTLLSSHHGSKFDTFLRVQHPIVHDFYNCERLVVADKLKSFYTTLGLRPNKAPVGTPISFRKLASGGTTVLNSRVSNTALGNCARITLFCSRSVTPQVTHSKNYPNPPNLRGRRGTCFLSSPVL